MSCILLHNRIILGGYGIIQEEEEEEEEDKNWIYSQTIKHGILIYYSSKTRGL